MTSQEEWNESEHICPDVLNLLATAAGVHDGPTTRQKLEELADRMLPPNPCGADYDGVIYEFKRCGDVLRKGEERETLGHALPRKKTTQPKSLKPNQVKALRVGAGISQTELAQRMELGQRGQVTVSYWETGRRNISPPMANLLKKVCAEAQGQ